MAHNTLFVNGSDVCTTFGSKERKSYSQSQSNPRRLRLATLQLAEDCEKSFSKKRSCMLPTQIFKPLQAILLVQVQRPLTNVKNWWWKICMDFKRIDHEAMNPQRIEWLLISMDWTSFEIFNRCWRNSSFKVDEWIHLNDDWMME